MITDNGGIFTDKSGMFKDFGFKLIVINSLLDKECSFTDELEQMKERYVDDYDGEMFVCIPDMAYYFQDLKLTKDDLAKVETLCFDGGNDIYFYLMPDWDGESDEFDVYSVKDYKLLPNLKKVLWSAMCDKALLDDFPDYINVIK